MLDIFLGIFLISLLCSCSISQTSPIISENGPVTKPIVNEQPLSPEEIEKERAVQRYQELRAQDWEKYIAKKKSIAQLRVRPEMPTTIPTSPPSTAPTILQRPDPESEMIADQKIRFHCSARITLHEKNKLQACLAQAQERWNNCKAHELNQQKALACLKRNL